MTAGSFGMFDSSTLNNFKGATIGTITSPARPVSAFTTEKDTCTLLLYTYTAVHCCSETDG